MCAAGSLLRDKALLSDGDRLQIRDAQQLVALGRGALQHGAHQGGIWGGQTPCTDGPQRDLHLACTHHSSVWKVQQWQQQATVSLEQQLYIVVIIFI